MNPLSALSLAEIRTALERGALSAREIVRHTLDHIDRQNPALNAFTHITRERMQKEADRLDRSRALGQTLPALAGIPYAVKNLFDVAGETTLAGARLFSERPPAGRDAWGVSRLADQGALLCGMLNMDAYAYGFTTENSHYGATRNPHDLGRIAGGSSGGSAAAVAAGLVTFSLGSDTNGSIRVPASLCGIYGLKPTFGRLSRSGSQPFVDSLDHIGPFARRVHDLATVYDAMQGIDAGDPFQSDRPITRTETLLTQGSQNLRCAVLGGYFLQWCNDDAKAAVNQVAQALAASAEVELPQAELARSAAFILSASEGGHRYLPQLRSQPERFEPLSRERLLAGAAVQALGHFDRPGDAMQRHADRPGNDAHQRRRSADPRQYGPADAADFLPWPAGRDGSFEKRIRSADRPATDRPAVARRFGAARRLCAGMRRHRHLRLQTGVINEQ